MTHNALSRCIARVVMTVMGCGFFLMTAALIMGAQTQPPPPKRKREVPKEHIRPLEVTRELKVQSQVCELLKRYEEKVNAEQKRKPMEEEATEQ